MTPFTRGLWCEREFTSSPGDTRCKRGEDFLVEVPLEVIFDQQHASGLLQRLAALLRTIFLGFDGDHFLVSAVGRIFLRDQLTGGPHGFWEAGQPGEPSPGSAVSQGGGPAGERMILAVVIDEGFSLVADGPSVGLFGAEEVLGFVDEDVAGELLAGQSERGDSR